MGMCRACLATGKDMVPMDEDFVNKYNVLTNLNLTLKEMSLYSCKACFEAIQFCTEFREKCISSDLTLKEILFPNSEQMDEFKIKDELKVEYESDSIPCEDLYDESFRDHGLIETEKDQDFLKVPKKTQKRMKKKVNVEQKQRMKKEEAKVKNELKKVYDDTVVPCGKKSNQLQTVGGICSKIFHNRVDFEKHFERHIFYKSCELCTEQLIDYAHLMAHRLVHLPENQQKCYLCSKAFIAKRPELLEFHYVKQHNLRGEDGKLLCKTCLNPFGTLRNLGKHVSVVHSDIKYTCNECGKGFRVKQALQTHLTSHGEEKRYECDLCDFTCKLSGGLRDHKLRKHTEGRVYCKPCGRPFRSQEMLNKHACKHDQKAICPICGKNVTTKSQLARHIESHTTYRYECSLCPSKFKSRSSFYAHKNKHAGIRPHRCEQCPMSFYSQSVLIKHRRTHTGERPYVCKICQKGFMANYNLKVHFKVHGQDLIVKRNTEPQVLIF